MDWAVWNNRRIPDVVICVTLMRHCPSHEETSSVRVLVKAERSLSLLAEVMVNNVKCEDFFLVVAVGLMVGRVEGRS